MHAALDCCTMHAAATAVKDRCHTCTAALCNLKFWTTQSSDFSAVLLVTLFLALTALQFVVSTNLPNSRCASADLATLD